MSHSFEVYHKRKLVFFSDEHWLYPLFQFSQYLENSELKPQELSVRDKIVGKAAALVLVHLNIKVVHAGMLSHLGMSVLKRWKVQYSFDNLVDRIQCQTENMLMNEEDPASAVKVLRNRIKQNKRRPV